LYANPDQPGTVEPDQWWQWTLLVAPALVATFRRANPTVAAMAVTLAQATIWVSNLPEFVLALIVVLYTAASDGGRRGVQVAVVCAVGLTALSTVGLQVAEDVAVYQVPLVALTCGVAITLGAAAARQRERAAELAAQVTAVRLEGEHGRRQAVVDERSSIAKELHDIIGHALATIAVRAEAADRVAAKQPEAAAEAIASIAVAARASLDETRRVLAGLRTADTAELAPPPDLASIERLVEPLREAGVDVALSSSGCEDHEPPAVVIGGAYRIVQESLTNAIKHGGPDTSVAVELRCGPDRLDVRIVNSLPAVPDPVGVSMTPGNGMSGMAERAEVLGGTFGAGLTDEGFVVEATLPARSER
jgi:signal transduction histidine kinase